MDEANKGPKRDQHYTYLGESKTLSEWSKHTGIDRGTIASRLREGMSVEEALTKKPARHGMRYTSEYNSWHAMNKRCYDVNHTRYPQYGGKGVTVCDRWKDARNFFEDMGPKPSPTYTLDRIDNDKGYCPENCRWLDKPGQQRNRRYVHKIEFNGKVLSAPEWEEITGLRSATILTRLLKLGWSVEEALTTPLRGR